MRGVTGFLAILGLLTVGGVRQAAAQHPQTREGFWIGFGFGYGTASVTNDTIRAVGGGSREGGATGFLKMGGTLSKSVLLGGEVNAWVKSDSGVTAELGNVSAAVYFYPAPASGFFLKGGVGYGSTRFHNSGTASANGFGFVTGIGYDVRVGRNISITPVANFTFGSDGDLKENGTTLDTGYRHNVFDFALGITFH